MINWSNKIMKKINVFYLSLALFSLSSVFNSALAIENTTYPGAMCSAFSGAQQARIRTRTGRRSNQLYVEGSLRDPVTVKCPIPIHDVRGGRSFTVTVNVFHPTARRTSCVFVMAHRRTLANPTANSIILPRTTPLILSNQRLTFRVNSTRPVQNAMVRCTLRSGNQGGGDAGGTRLVSYQVVSN